MPSRRVRARPDQNAPVCFVDRALGRFDVPEGFRRAGHEVVLMSELQSFVRATYPRLETSAIHVSSPGWRRPVRKWARKWRTDSLLTFIASRNEHAAPARTFTSYIVTASNEGGHREGRA